MSSGPPVATHAFDAITARALGIGGETALLVRPDGIPVALLAASTSRPHELRRAMAAVGSELGGDLATAAAA
jgi:hypothetical protein